MSVELSALTAELPIGNGANRSVIETTGIIRAEGSARAFRDELPVYLNVAGGAAAPDEENHTIGGVARRLYCFNGAATEERLSGSFEIPHDYAYGTEIEIHVHFRPTTNDAGNVEWFFDWEHSPAQSAPEAQTTLSAVIPILADTQYHHYVKTIGVLPANGYALGDKIGFNIRRTPNGDNDTYGADVAWEQIAMHIQVDTHGSRQRYVK